MIIMFKDVGNIEGRKGCRKGSSVVTCKAGDKSRNLTNLLSHTKTGMHDDVVLSATCNVVLPSVGTASSSVVHSCRLLATELFQLLVYVLRMNHQAMPCHDIVCAVGWRLSVWTFRSCLSCWWSDWRLSLMDTLVASVTYCLAVCWHEKFPGCLWMWAVVIIALPFFLSVNIGSFTVEASVSWYTGAICLSGASNMCVWLALKWSWVCVLL